MGISDTMRQFHLVAIFITSQMTHLHFAEAFASLKRIYSTVIGCKMTVKYVMADADDGQLNALEQVFGERVEDVEQLTPLICYCHVAAKVYERRVFQDVGDMHFATSAAEFEQMRTSMTASWTDDPLLSSIAVYFTKQWLSTRFKRWQRFNSPPGIAMTNNPVEQYNRAIKRDYTLSARLKVGSLLDQLLQCCRVESLKQRSFAEQPTPSLTLLRRVRERQRTGKIRELQSARASIGFLLGEEAEANANIAFVYQKAATECTPQKLNVSGRLYL